MSETLGHVTRKDGRILQFPDRVEKSFRWLVGASFVTPLVMLLIGFGDPKGVAGPTAGVILSILPVGLVTTTFVALLRQGTKGITAYAFALTLLNYLALTVEPHTDSLGEMLYTRGIPLLGVGIVLVFLRRDLRFNLRPLWYSLQAMKELQETMMKARARKEAKKRGQTFDESKFMDAEAVVRDVQARTGRELPTFMQGINVKPGFREQAKSKQRHGGRSSKQRKKRR